MRRVNHDETGGTNEKKASEPNEGPDESPGEELGSGPGDNNNPNDAKDDAKTGKGGGSKLLNSARIHS